MRETIVQTLKTHYGVTECIIYERFDYLELTCKLDGLRFADSSQVFLHWRRASKDNLYLMELCFFA